MIMYQTSGVAGGSDDGPVEGNLFPALQSNSKVKTPIENQIWLTFVPHVHLTRIDIAIIVLAKCIYINLTMDTLQYYNIVMMSAIGFLEYSSMLRI